MKILLIHTKYQQSGGEDSVVSLEETFLRRHYSVDTLFFQNKEGIKGVVQFLFSLWNFRAASILKKRIKEFQPDIIHVHNWHFASGPIIFRVAKNMNVPVIHTVHNYRLLCPSAILLHNNLLFTKSLQQQFPWTAVREKVYRNSLSQTFWLAFVVWFHKRIGTWNKVDKFICLTTFAVDLFQKSTFGISIDKFTIKPNFTEVNPNPTLEEREDNFLFIGRLSEEKGIRILIDAFKTSNLILHIAGDGPLKKEIQQIQEKYSNIQYLGLLSKSEILLALQQTQALVFPSVWFEGMPMTIVESLSSGTPIIASRLGAMESMVQNGSNGFLFQPSNHKDLLDKIERFALLSKDEKNTLQKNTLASFYQNYTMESQIGYFAKIFKSVMK